MSSQFDWRLPVAVPWEAGYAHGLRIPFLGYMVASLTMEEAVGWVLQAVRNSSFHHIAVLNANKMWLAHRSPELHRIVLRAELVIPEFAVVWGCKVMKTPVRGHLGGIMLLSALLPTLAAHGVPVYFLGAREEVLQRMVARLRRQHPSLPVVGARSGYFQPAESEQIVRTINASGAQALFVAMGSPRQELWIEAHREHLKVRVAMGVGGSFDVLAGIKKDAPPYLRHGWEWLYRLAQDPRPLWKRYLRTNPWFVARVLRERWFSGRI